MNANLIAGLSANAALLLSLGLLYDFAFRGRTAPVPILHKIVSGILIGAIAVVLMLTPVNWEAGVIFDARTILLGLTGLFFGSIPTLVATGIAGAYRLNLGGAGALAGVATILSSALIGLVWRHYRFREAKELPFSEMYLFGGAVHAAMLLCLLLLPQELVRKTIASLALPILVIYPLCTALLGNVLAGRQRKSRLEQELAHEKALFEAIFKGIPDAIVYADVERTIVAINPGFTSVLGYSVDNLAGKKTSFFYESLEEYERQGRLRFNLTATEQARPYEVNYRKKNGAIFPGETLGTVIKSAGGEVLGYVGVIRDISERKQAEAYRLSLEAQLRESQKLEALGTLAGGVAHDFNNTLATILGNVELARQDVGSGHPALVSLNEIGEASHRAKDLVQQILAFGRRQTFERKAVSLAPVVEETARLLRATIPARITLQVACAADTPAVLADATQVKLALLHLCTNALHAVEDQARPGVIQISLTTCSRDDAPYGGAEPRTGGARPALQRGFCACLAVSDNGPGMDADTRARMFEPFFTTKPVGKGSGLGLSAVHGIVQAHEASIEVDSIPGTGSTLRIYFPAIDAPVAAAAPPAPDAGSISGAGKHVLYVDDEEAIIFLMKRLLERQGFRVSGYTDAGEALAAVRSNPDQFDLAVTDYNMPGMSGLELARALKEIRADLPVVLASGYITEELRANAPAAGVRELIYKPNTVEDLCDAVARCANAQVAK